MEQSFRRLVEVHSLVVPLNRKNLQSSGLRVKIPILAKKIVFFVFESLPIETDKEMYRQELLNQPMRVQIVGLPACSYNFIIRVKKTQQIKRILIGWEETNELCLSFDKVSWTHVTFYLSTLYVETL